jgi:hypothetical protein
MPSSASVEIGCVVANCRTGEVSNTFLTMRPVRSGNTK